MFTSFSTALSALNATSTAIDVVGNNLANLNTTGYKESVVSFHDLVTQSLGAGLGETQVGFGTARPLTRRQFSQGAVQASSGTLDAAIQGDGFFVVKNSSGAQLYTRAGDFNVDKSGYLLTSTGEFVQGWTANSGTMNTNAAVTNIQIPVGELRAPVATTALSFDVNLNSAGTVGDTTGTYSTAVTAYDSLGNTVVLTATFTKTAALTWDYQISVPGEATTAGRAGTPTDLLTPAGTLTFDTNGKLLTPATAAAGAIPVAVTGLADSAADMSITWNFYNGTVPRITQYAQTSAVSADAQDGSPASQLTKVGIGDGGEVLAQYSDGTQKVVAQLALASVRNPDSLMAVGNNNYQASEQTALPAVGVANSGGRGQILGGNLEASTVDIAQEFTNLITLQRAYEANAKVISTADQLSQDTINLTR